MKMPCKKRVSLSPFDGIKMNVPRSSAQTFFSGNLQTRWRVLFDNNPSSFYTLKTLRKINVIWKTVKAKKNRLDYSGGISRGVVVYGHEHRTPPDVKSPRSAQDPEIIDHTRLHTRAHTPTHTRDDYRSCPTERDRISRDSR